MLQSALRRCAAWPAMGFFLALSISCSHDDVPRRARPAAPAEPSFQVFGDYEVHYNAIRTDELSAEVAQAYDIERSANRVLLNVVLLRKTADGRTRAADGEVSASAHNLNGQVKNLRMRRVSVGDTVDFLGEVSISGDEILIFDIVAAPRGGGERLSAQLKREFFGG